MGAFKNVQAMSHFAAGTLLPLCRMCMCIPAGMLMPRQHGHCVFTEHTSAQSTSGATPKPARLNANVNIRELLNIAKSLPQKEMPPS